MYSLHGSENGWRPVVLPLFGLILLLHGCSGVVGLTPDPAPMTPGAIVTDTWFYKTPQGTVEVSGTWVHLPEYEAGELELWIERVEASCR